ncbi:MAG: phosphotransferase, partial [Clostridia bacterium]|nr:phosphotransferase [Clostridia bacterium]
DARPEPCCLFTFPAWDRYFDSENMFRSGRTDRLLVASWGGAYPPFSADLKDRLRNMTADPGAVHEALWSIWPECLVLLVPDQLKACYRNLPRCVFQGDENFSNILVDENRHFAGFIDFNLAGTEVIVNQLANLAGFDYDEKNPEPEGAGVRLEHGIAYFWEHMGLMLRVYDASGEELRALGLYAWIVMTAQWPVFCYFRACIRGKLKSEILEMLSLIAELPEEQLLP